MADALDPPSFEYPYRTRVTVDIDHYAGTPRLRVLRAYNALQRAGAKEVLVAVSSGGLGYHIEARFAREFTDEAAERFRRTLADDSKRVDMDVERSEYEHTDNVFWHQKGDNEGERQVFETPGDAFEYVSQTRRSDHERARALCLYGHKGVTDTVVPWPSNVRNCQCQDSGDTNV